MIPPRHAFISAAAALTAAVALAGCGATPAPKTQDSPKVSPSPILSTPTSSAPSPAAGTCQYVASGQKAARRVTPPPSKPVTKPGKLTITTNFGKVAITLAGKTAPCAVNNFISLAKQGFYDNTPCHRITDYPTFKVLQCGDPTGTGTGDPGYAFASELTGKEKYTAGTVAMANTGQPVSQGSQFFLVYGNTKLSPNYTIFGQMSASGVKTVQKISKNGLIPNPQMGPADGAPKKKVEILSVK